MAFNFLYHPHCNPSNVRDRAIVQEENKFEQLEVGKFYKLLLDEEKEPGIYEVRGFYEYRPYVPGVILWQLGDSRGYEFLEEHIIKVFHEINTEELKDYKE